MTKPFVKLAEAKRLHPESWKDLNTIGARRAEIEVAYRDYVESLRQCGAAFKSDTYASWAVAFVVRAKKHDIASGQDPLAIMFQRRHRLIDLTSEETVIGVETTMPPHQVESKNAP